MIRFLLYKTLNIPFAMGTGRQCIKWWACQPGGPLVGVITKELTHFFSRVEYFDTTPTRRDAAYGNVKMF